MWLLARKIMHDCLAYTKYIQILKYDEYESAQTVLIRPSQTLGQKKRHKYWQAETRIRWRISLKSWPTKCVSNKKRKRKAEENSTENLLGLKKKKKPRCHKRWEEEEDESMLRQWDWSCCCRYGCYSYCDCDGDGDSDCGWGSSSAAKLTQRVEIELMLLLWLYLLLLLLLAQAKNRLQPCLALPCLLLWPTHAQSIRPARPGYLEPSGAQLNRGGESWRS